MSHFVIPEIKAAEEEMIAIRHYLHAHPELSLEEFNTSELVAEKLAVGLYGDPRTGENRAGGIAKQRAFIAYDWAARRYGRAADC
jgi:metal-dependent amidase/aminoacylase/carboxypeptidase family protein